MPTNNPKNKNKLEMKMYMIKIYSRYLLQVKYTYLIHI